MTITTNDISVVLHKKGWMPRSLRAGARRNRFVMQVHETPLVVSQKLALDLSEGLSSLNSHKYNVQIDQIQFDPLKKLCTISIDARLDGDKVMLGDVVLSASGYTGQVEELSDTETDYPQLARVFWYKFRALEDCFYTWETADNLTVMNYPIPGQWWPGLDIERPGHAIPKDRPWNRNPVGTPIHELAMRQQAQDFERVLEIEASLNTCACGCGRTCKKNFAPGHDAKAHRLLQLYVEGKGDDKWKPSEKLQRYVKTHEAWRAEFSAVLSEI